ncbi:MAG TPA: hypothetical protein VHB53_13070 [Solirubrobacterales bacterium]|nr:hypothetical protein [Solirubrobacterales bacterium]
MAAPGENPTTEDDDTRLESVLLRRVLDLHPTRVTADELILDLTGSEPDFAARDGVERAIGELVRAGLLHPADDGFVTPTRAAVRLGELLGPLT